MNIYEEYSFRMQQTVNQNLLYFFLYGKQLQSNMEIEIKKKMFLDTEDILDISNHFKLKLITRHK